MNQRGATKSRPGEQAFAIGCRKIAGGARDLRRVAAEAAAEAFCSWLTDGEDRAEERLSAIHADLFEHLKIAFCAAAREVN